MEDDQKRLVDVAQTIVIVVIAIPFGVIPLVQQVLGRGGGGLLHRVAGDLSGSARWVVPIVVIVAAAIIVMALEAVPRRGRRIDR